MPEKEQTPFFIDLNLVPRLEQVKGLETAILAGMHGEKMMMVLNATFPGHVMPEHSHPNEQVGMVYSGKGGLRIGEDERLVKRGAFYRIPADVPHSATCIGDEPFIMLDIFYPVREDIIARLQKNSKA